MNQSLIIAWRNVARQRKRSFLLAGAIGFAFLIITLVGGFTAGLADTARTNFSNALGGHLYFSGDQVSGLGSEISVISDATALNTVLDSYKDSISNIHRRSSTMGSLIAGTTELRQKIAGVDFAAETDFRQNLELVEGSLNELNQNSALVLPQETATKLGVKVGETVIFKSQTVTGQQNVTELKLIATITSQSMIGVSSGFANLSTVNALIGLEEGQYQTVNVYLKDINQIDNMADRMYASLAALAPMAERANAEGNDPMKNMFRMMNGGGNRAIAHDDTWVGTKYTLTTLNELMAQFMMLISTVDQIGFWIFVILLVITMVGIMNSYRMVMVERTQEIGTMRAIGVQRGGIRNVFLFEALFLALLGACSGFFLALLIMLVTSLPTFGTQDMLAFFLNHGHFSFRVSGLDALKNTLVLCLLSLAAVYLPARTASRLEPAEALRSVY